MSAEVLLHCREIRMQQAQPQPIPQKRELNPVQDPQILPFSYSLPILSGHFSSPAASACLPQSFFELFLRKK
jgi:hypothetical protein